MDATTNFSLRVAEGSDAKAEKSKRAPLEKTATGISLVSLAVGFSILGTLIIANRDQADLSGISGGSSIAIVGGISAILVGTVFLVAAYLHWRFCARRSVAFPVRRQTARLTFSRAEPALPIAVFFS
jgi:hypothetical protein